MHPFRTRLSYDQRRAEFERIRPQLEARVPVILESNGLETPRMTREKFLVPFDLTVAQLAFVVRKRVHFDASRALFLMVRGTLPPPTVDMKSLYDRHMAEDGFLYVVYTTENTFGSINTRDDDGASQGQR